MRFYVLYPSFPGNNDCTSISFAPRAQLIVSPAKEHFRNDDTHEDYTMLITNEDSITRRLADFQAMALPDLPVSDFNALDLMSDEDAPDESERRGVVAGNSINTFEGEMSLANERDINNMGRYAAAYADRRADLEADTRNWYREYAKMMKTLGLGVQSFGFEELGTSDTSIKADAVALKLLGGAALGAGKAGQILIATMKDALAAIKDDEKALGVFEQRSSHKTGANFQMMPAAQKVNGSCIVLLSCTYFKTSINKGKVLFVSWNKSKIEIYGSAQRTLFIREDYDDEARQEVSRWLKQNAAKEFARMKLDDDKKK
ncbi:hypothetical protein [Pseudomonas sp. RIT-To-2]|uniref:hypothetical protein n=1 Tax=Pseudomonas sp. RIT-To-2 TaxID=3462541 RepID=UPI00241386C6